MTDNRLDEIIDRLNTLTTNNEELRKIVVALTSRVHEMEEGLYTDNKRAMFDHSLGEENDAIKDNMTDYLQGKSKGWWGS